MTSDAQTFPEDIIGLCAVLVAEQAARQAVEEEALDARARVSGAETIGAHLKLLIAELKQERFGASAERGRKLNQLELRLEEIETNAAEDETAARAKQTCKQGGQRSSDRRRPFRNPLHTPVPRERVVSPSACACCQCNLVKLGEDVTETLEVALRSWKVVQTVRKELTCRAGGTISQVPAPFHVIARGRASGLCWR